MTVADLITRLKELDETGDLEVFVDCDDWPWQLGRIDYVERGKKFRNIYDKDGTPVLFVNIDLIRA